MQLAKEGKVVRLHPKEPYREAPSKPLGNMIQMVNCLFHLRKNNHSKAKFLHKYHFC